MKRTNVMERTSVFIDGSNLYAASRACQFDIDYKKLLDHLGTTNNIAQAYYFTAITEDEEFVPLRPLVDWLAYNGWNVVTKPTKSFKNDGVIKIKGNMDIEIAVHMLTLADYVDHMILASGDGDFRILVEAVQRKGVKVSVLSTAIQGANVVADELRRQADRFIELADIRKFVERERRQQEVA